MKAHDIELIGDDIIIEGIRATDTTFNIKTSSGELAIVLTDNGSVALYYDNVKVAETTSAGITGAVWG